MSNPSSEQCPKCGSPKSEVVEVRAQVTKPTSRATAMLSRKTGPKRTAGVRFVEMPSIVTLYRCKKCGHELTKTTA